LDYRAEAAPSSWLKVSATAGKTPGVLQASVDASKLGEGEQHGTITIRSGKGVEQVVAVQLTVQRTPPPPPPPDKTESNTAGDPVSNTRILPDLGFAKGDISWTGDLAPNQQIVITREGGANQGGGRVTKAPALPDSLKVVQVFPEGMSATVQNRNQLVIRNTTGKRVSNFTVHWTRP
jgi:hypothetical protein